MKIKNVLVTGASGKIGRNLVPALVSNGYHVRVVQFQTPVDFESAEKVIGSVEDSSFVKEALEDIDAVCHLATCKEDKDHFLDVSVRGTFNLLDESKNSKCIKQFILSSGDAVLGIYFYSNPYPLDENAPLKAYPGYYAFSKVIEETMCNQYSVQHNLPVTILRFSWILDEDDILAHMTLRAPDFGAPVWKEIAKNSKQKEYFEKDSDAVGCLFHPNAIPYKRHIIGIKDVVQSILLALGNPRSLGETFNIASASAFSYDVLAEYIGNKLNLPVVGFEMDDFHDFAIDINKARSILGYRPEYNIFQIVDDAIEFRKQGKTRSPIKYQG